MPTVNPVNDELKSDIVKVTPAIAKDAVIKTVNGIIDYLKRYGLLYQDAINKPTDGSDYLDYYKDNKVINENYDMATVKEKIDNLQYLSAPITVQAMRVEINKIVDIFKSDSRIASSDDFKDLVDEFLKEIVDLDRIDYGVASSIYVVEDIIEYGNAATINSEQL